MIEPIGFHETDDEYVARLEAEIARLTAVAQRRPMRADIVQIIDRGWKAGKSSNDVAEEILREFDPSPVSSTKCGGSDV